MVVFFGVAADLGTKAIFRFELLTSNFPMVLYQDHIEIGVVLFNYGNIWINADERNAVSLLIAAFNWVLIFVLLALVDQDPDELSFGGPILAGAFGNELDRLLFGNVCDWILLSLTGENAIVFNIADLLIWFGMTTLIIEAAKNRN